MSLQSMSPIQGPGLAPAIQNTPTTPPRTSAGVAPTAGAAQTPLAKADNATAGGSEPSVDANELAGAIQKVQDFTHTLANELNFSIDDDSGHTVVKIVDTSTKEVIRQIPSKEMLAIAQTLDKIQGLLIKQKA